MSIHSYKTMFVVDQTPDEVFSAIINTRKWWSGNNKGDPDHLGAEFTHHYKDMHRAKMRVTEFLPGKKIAWRVLDNYFKFTKDKTEWIGTDIVFEIVKKGDKTELHFTHIGLVPAYECYGVCSNAWGSLIGGSLKSLITTGKGHPNS